MIQPSEAMIRNTWFNGIFLISAPWFDPLAGGAADGVSSLRLSRQFRFNVMIQVATPASG